MLVVHVDKRAAAPHALSDTTLPLAARFAGWSQQPGRCPRCGAGTQRSSERAARGPLSPELYEDVTGADVLRHLIEHGTTCRPPDSPWQWDGPSLALDPLAASASSGRACVDSGDDYAGCGWFDRGEGLGW